MTDLTPARQSAARRTHHGLRAGAVAFAAAGAVGFMLLTPGVANADPAPAPRLVLGNVATCEQADLEGEIILGGEEGSATSPAGTGTVTDKTLDVTINAGFTATGIVVKGGPNANVYDGPFVGPTEVEGMVAPTTASGEPAGISHWFVCGFETPSTPSPTPTTESPTPTPTTPPPSESVPPSGSTPPPGSVSPTAPGGPGLPVTGAAATTMALTGLGLIGGGVALVWLRRRRDISFMS
jgi:LPXTG-motif cell wall-anchored protein